ncbi:hypothetical protein B9Z55_002890 [Caenorhabditis nigoni]|uniref:Uncharacterized protein n=1 Tax=Caenorhabditis nigoni TaxID=1611254 RepID=A0A2G5VMM9_9PELO|nr:hypothetical protein B9Z55_002890 [Caenorhabditis nigoni]
MTGCTRNSSIISEASSLTYGPFIRMRRRRTSRRRRTRIQVPDARSTNTKTCLKNNFFSRKSERALFLAILEEMMCEDGTCKMSWIHSIIQKEPHKITGPKCDEFMTRMARQKYFTLLDTDIVEIAPRTIVELEPWLRATMPGSV